MQAIAIIIAMINILRTDTSVKSYPALLANIFRSAEATISTVDLIIERTVIKSSITTTKVFSFPADVLNSKKTHYLTH